MTMSIADNLNRVMDRIAAAAQRAGRDPSNIKVVVVTKTIEPERIREAIAAGARILGENRVQEAREKIGLLEPMVSWHMIGRLQTNKAKYAVKLFQLIHSVDSLTLAKEIDRQAAKIQKVQDVLIEVNLAGEKSKGGVAAAAALDLIREAAGLKNIRIIGLMTMPPYTEDPENSRPYFRRLRELAEWISRENIPNISLRELSMGMSADFDTAVEEGATMVRIGTAIFGERR